MSELRSYTTVPTDALVVSRKVRKGSKANISHSVTSAITVAGLLNDPDTNFRETKICAVDLLKREDYVKHKLSHPILGLWSPNKLADAFNNATDGVKDSVNDFVDNAEIGAVDYERIGAGMYIVGLLFNETYKEQLARDRVEVIDTLIDVSGISLSDPVRQWRNEGHEEIWLPVVILRSNSTQAKEIVEDFSEALQSTTESMAIDLFDAQARPVFVSMPVPV